MIHNYILHAVTSEGKSVYIDKLNSYKKRIAKAIV